ncbi:MSC_0622 family F1-like ATPase gamma subunit [Mycoplasmopsis opalescens]|uniref:MSC_0622 family F1-like ATPase gamma subunit n=1 Tax=Mycoplasmopsis opalescens TaxID=114886 RepID=UPI0004A6F0A5|nr:hypothetical protein [Mycoplasmopsis opalescens]
MQLVKLLDKRKKLNFIHKRVSNNKNILLIKIIKMTKKLKFCSKKAFECKNIITVIKKTYKVNNEIVDRNLSLLFGFFKKNILKKVKDPELFVYLTDEQKYGTDSYSRYEKTLIKEAKSKNMHFITIGNRAIEFCKNNDFNVVQHFDAWDNSSKFINNFCELIKQYYLIGGYKKVNFVLNSNKNHDQYFTILPLKNFNLEKLVGKFEEEFDHSYLTKGQIFPNVNEFYDNIIDQFIYFSVQALFIESSFYQAKIDLITSNKINSELEESIAKLNKKILSAKREKEIEEINIITRKKKSILNLEGKNV